MVLTLEKPTLRFEQIVLPHLDSAYNLARWLVADPALAEDVVQDASVRALNYFATYRGGDGRAWFLRIVRNTAMTSLSHRSKRRDVPLDTVDDQDGNAAPAALVADPASNPEESYARTQASSVLDAALAMLTPELRECLVMRECEELSYREISDVVGVPIGTVMSRLWRARQALACALKKGDMP